MSRLEVVLVHCVAELLVINPLWCTKYHSERSGFSWVFSG